MREQTEIICTDVNSKCENAAFDMEQALTNAMQNVPQKNVKATKKQLAADEKKDQDYFEKDSPTLEEIDNHAFALEMAVKSNSSVKMSEILEIFMDFINAGVVRCVGDQKITTPIWDSISRRDKMKIVFRYCSFFVNPLEQLVNMASSMEEKA